MKTTRLLLLSIVAALFGCTSAPAQTKALTKTIATDTLTEGFTVGANQTLTISANATLALPDNALQIADTSGLQAALDSKLTLATGNATYQPLSANLTSWAAKAPYAGTLTITANKTLAATNTLTLTGTDNSTLAIGTGGTLGSAAYRSVGQSSGNIVEVGPLGGVTLPGGSELSSTGAGLSVYDSVTNTNLLFGGPASGTTLWVRSTNLTASRTVNWPDKSGTFAFTNDLTALNASNLTTGTVDLARLVNTQTVGDGNATITAGTRDILLTAALTAPRTYTLPAASAYPAGARLTFVDMANTLTATNTATLARAGSDLLNNATSLTLNTPGAAPLLISDGTSRWNLDIRGVSRAGTGLTTLTAGSLLSGNGTSPVTLIAPGTTGNVLTSNGTAWTSAAPSGGGGGNITINTTAPLTVNGNATATTSNATLAITAATTSAAGSVQLATQAQALAGTSSSLAITPATLQQALHYLTARTTRITYNITALRTTVVSNGGSVSPFDARHALSSSSTSNGTARYGYNTGAINNTAFSWHNSTTVDPRAMDWSRPVWVTVQLQPNTFNATTNGFIRCTLGSNSAAANYTLDVRGIGWTVNASKQIRILAHNGTSLTTSASMGTLAWTSGIMEELTFYSDGAGNVSLYRAGVLLGSTTGGPTTAGSNNQNAFLLEVGNGGDAATIAVDLAQFSVTVY